MRDHLGNDRNFAYDAAGRMVKEGEKTYKYGYLDKVLSVTEGSDKYTYDYHVDGQLATATYGNTTEDFLWDGLALVKRGKRGFVNEPHIGGGNPVMSSDGTTYFNDMLGTTLSSSVNGETTASSLTAFGAETHNSQLTTHNSASDSFFTGKPFVPGLGHAFLFRNYRSDLGKWQTADPLGYPDGWNQLAYCGNGVTSAVDLWGGRTETVADPGQLENHNYSEEWGEWSVYKISVVGPYTLTYYKKTGKEYCDIYVKLFQITSDNSKFWAVVAGMIGSEEGALAGGASAFIDACNEYEVKREFAGLRLYKVHAFVRDLVAFRVKITE